MSKASCAFCAKEFIKKHVKHVFCSWGCVVGDRRQNKKTVAKELLIELMLKHRYGAWPNWSEISRQLGNLSWEVLDRVVQSHNLIDNKRNGPIVDGVYLPIPVNNKHFLTVDENLISKEMLETRLLRRCEKEEKCWIWTGNWDKRGYGLMYLARPYSRRVKVHHVAAYVWLDLPLTAKKFIFHTCHVRACINPDHFIICKDKAKVVKLMMKHRLTARGGRNAKSKIDLTTALDIRDALRIGNETYQQIADRLAGNVTRNIVSNIARRKHWRHIWNIKHEYC